MRRQSSVEWIKSCLPRWQTVRCEPDSRGERRDRSKQGSVDAAKFRAGPPHSQSKELDVDALLSSLTLTIPVPVARPRHRVSTWEERRRVAPGSIHAWSRLWNVEDEEHGREDARAEEAPPRLARVKQSSIVAGKLSLQPGYGPHGSLLAANVPRVASRGRPPKEASVNVWDDAPVRQCTVTSLACYALSLAFRFISEPPLAGAKLLGVLPGSLVAMWFLVVRSWPLGPLAPFVALTMTMPIIFAQTYAAAFPLTGAIALLAIQLGDLIDGAFAAMDERLRASLLRSVASLALPPAVEARVVAIMYQPPATAIRVVRSLLPDFGALFPLSFRRGSTLAPLVFVFLLLVMLAAQLLPLMMLGLAGNGDLAIVLGVAVCVCLARLALAAASVLELLVWLIERIVNGLVQYLLRKVLSVRRLQALLDVAHDPKRVLGLAARSDSSVAQELGQLVHWKYDETAVVPAPPIHSACGSYDVLAEPSRPAHTPSSQGSEHSRQ